MRRILIWAGIGVCCSVAASLAEQAQASTRTHQASVRSKRVVVHCAIGAYAGPLGEQLSPSGASLVVQRLASVNRVHLSIISIRTGAERHVRGTFVYGVTPLWAPNSKEFAVRNLDGSLAVVNASTGVGRTLMTPAPGASIFASGWSPRSDHLLVTENTSQVPTVPRFELLAVGVPDGHVHDLGPGAGGAYSPDGSTVAYFDSGNLKLLNLITGIHKTLAPPYYPLQGWLSWAPNGHTVAYSEGDTGFIPIVLNATPVNGSHGRVMGLLPGGFDTPLWARNLLVWLPHGGGHPASGIAVGDPTTGQTHILQPLAALRALQVFVAGPASVLPGETRIVYDVVGSGNRDLGLRTISVNGGGDAPLVACRGRGHDDLVIGTPANDVINVRNGSIDTVTCLAGTDTVLADRRDHISRSCEHVHRS